MYDVHDDISFRINVSMLGPQVKSHLDFFLFVCVCVTSSLHQSRNCNTPTSFGATHSVKLNLADMYFGSSPAQSFSVTNKESVTRNLNCQSSFNAQISPPALSLSLSLSLSVHFTADWEFLFVWKVK